MTSPKHLLDQVNLLTSGRRRLRNADLKRATSTAYYALFHALAQRFANELIGHRHRQTAPWIKVYRALEHGKARQEFKRLLPTAGPGALQEIALLFVELQELRHLADYDPGPSRLTRIGVQQYRMRTEAVIEAFDLLSSGEWRDIATSVLLRDRK